MKLPAFTFIHGPAKLATEVANLITDNLTDVQGHSFHGPLRDATLGLFYGGDPSIDVGAQLDKHTPLGQEADITFGKFIEQMHKDLKIIYGVDVLGQLAVVNLQDNAEYFSRFVFDDLTFETLVDARRIIKAFSAENCLIINLVADGGSLPLSSREVRIIDILCGDSTSDIIQTIAQELERYSANPENPANTESPSP